eukprot:scpid91022/ scgid4927/ Transcription initiation protein SPT3 homolog; SPT3-like protein
MSSSSSFQLEIQNTLVAMTGNPTPTPDVARLLEEIMRKEAADLVCQIAHVTTMRGARAALVDDILFALRGNKGRIARLALFLGTKMKYRPSTDEGAMVNGQPSPKRKLLCADFLSSVDNLSGNVDEWLSVNNPTLGFSADKVPTEFCQYQEVLELLLVPYYRKSVKFRDWLETCVEVEVKFHGLLYDVLSIIMSEVIAEYIHMASAVRLERHVATYRADSQVFVDPSTSIWSGVRFVSPSAVTSNGLTSSSNDKPASGKAGRTSSSDSTSSSVLTEPSSTPRKLPKAKVV